MGSLSHLKKLYKLIYSITILQPWSILFKLNLSSALDGTPVAAATTTPPDPGAGDSFWRPQPTTRKDKQLTKYQVSNSVGAKFILG